MTSTEDLGFAYQVTKSGDVRISREGRVVTTLRGRSAATFAKRVVSLSSGEQQQMMARMTGNYKRGNERAARNKPDNR